MIDWSKKQQKVNSSSDNVPRLEKVTTVQFSLLMSPTVQSNQSSFKKKVTVPFLDHHKPKQKWGIKLVTTGSVFTA